MSATKASLIMLVAASAAATDFNPLQHLGGSGPWFPGPNVFNISPEPPAGCTVDQAAFLSRHGSRYPDPGAYNGWLTLSEKARPSTAFETY